MWLQEKEGFYFLDKIFVARQLHGKYQEQNIDIYLTYVDFTEVFDKVSIDGLWKTIKSLDAYQSL